jgi:hypothetical protein
MVMTMKLCVNNSVAADKSMASPFKALPTGSGSWLQDLNAPTAVTCWKRS